MIHNQGYKVPRFFAEMSFDGTSYHGWQKQSNAISIQEVVNHHLSLVLGEKIELTGAGRTDTGVHASYYIAHFDSRNSKLEQDSKILARINSFLPADIAIHRFLSVRDNAHARFDATSRTYKYYISRKKNPFQQKYAHYYFGKLNIAAMNEAGKILLSHNDFQSFCKKGSDEQNHQCVIMEAQWREENNLLIWTITANRFLRNMVRAIVGTLLEVGKDQLTLNEWNEVLKSGNRSEAGDSVPGKGLFLTNITYPIEIFARNT